MSLCLTTGFLSYNSDLPDAQWRSCWRRGRVKRPLASLEEIRSCGFHEQPIVYQPQPCEQFQAAWGPPSTDSISNQCQSSSVSVSRHRPQLCIEPPPPPVTHSRTLRCTANALTNISAIFVGIICRMGATLLLSYCNLFIPPPTVVAGGIIFYCCSFFLFFIFFSFATGSPRWLYRQGTFLAQMVRYGCNFENLVQNLGGDPH